MDIRELDRRITRTELTPASKKALKGVRKAILSGRAGDDTVGRSSWAIEVQSLNGTPLRISFRFKRDE